MTPRLQAYVDEYLSITRMDDPDRLVLSDLEIGHGYGFTIEERTEALDAILARKGEFRRISPEEECAQVAKVLSSTSKWAYGRARAESTAYQLDPDTSYHPPLLSDDSEDTPNILSVRKGSALGAAMGILSQFANHVHVAESRLRDGVGLRKTLAKMGVTDPMLQRSFYAFNGDVSETYRGWTEVDDVEAQAVADYAGGTLRSTTRYCGEPRALPFRRTYANLSVHRLLLASPRSTKTQTFV